MWLGLLRLSFEEVMRWPHLSIWKQQLSLSVASRRRHWGKRIESGSRGFLAPPNVAEIAVTRGGQDLGFVFVQRDEVLSSTGASGDVVLEKKSSQIALQLVRHGSRLLTCWSSCGWSAGLMCS
jgi:hypothetical protein